MEISKELITDVISFLQNLPLVNDKNGRAGLLLEANIDQSLFHLISFEGANSIFFSELVYLFLQYGQLEDGRYALQAILETAKNRIGLDKRKYCDTLLLRWQQYQQKQLINFSQSESNNQNINSTTIQTFPLRIMVTGGRNTGEQAMKIAYLIGQYVILREHKLISNGSMGIDEASCKGAYMACRIKNIIPESKIYIFRPQKHPNPHVNFGHIEIIGESYDERRNVVVEQSHAVIILGGKNGTYAVVRQAQIMKKPFVPVRVGACDETSVILWHKMYHQDKDSLPYTPIKKENLQKIDAQQDDFENVALSAVMIAENLAYDKNRIERIPNDALAGDAKGRAGKLVANPGGWLRPPFVAPEAPC